MDNLYTSISQLPLILNVEQVSHLLSISRAGAYELFHNDTFPCIRLNKRMLVERDKLLAWIEQNTNTT